MLSQTASTTRRQKTGNKFAQGANLPRVACSVPYPADPEIRNRPVLDTPYELFEVFTEVADIREGDHLVYDGTDYPIHSCGNWPVSNGRFLHLIIVELKS